MKLSPVTGVLSLGRVVYTPRIIGGQKVEKFKERATILAINGDQVLVQFFSDLPEIAVARRMKSDLFEILGRSELPF